jgi:hypothetical protein
MTIDVEVKVLSEVDRTTGVNRKARNASESLKAAGSTTCGATDRNRI